MEDLAAESRPSHSRTKDRSQRPPSSAKPQSSSLQRFIARQTRWFSQPSSIPCPHSVDTSGERHHRTPEEEAESTSPAATQQLSRAEEEEWGAWVDAADSNYTPDRDDSNEDEVEWSAWADSASDKSHEESGTIDGTPSSIREQSVRIDARAMQDVKESPGLRMDLTPDLPIQFSAASAIPTAKESGIELYSNPWSDGDVSARHIRKAKELQESRLRQGSAIGSECTSRDEDSCHWISAIRYDGREDVQFNPWDAI